MSEFKKIYASIYLENEKATKSLISSDYLAESPVELAIRYSNDNVDGIIVFDKSPSGDDKAHEKALDIIKEICKNSDVPVIGAGNVKRMEDIKKLLYAGCKKACLNFSKAGNIDILKEVSDKFGKDKIVICYKDEAQIIDNKSAVKEFSNELIYISPGKADTTISDEIDLPVIVLKDNHEVSPLDILKENDIIFGISGNIINDNFKDVSSIKAACLKEGLNMFRFIPEFTWENLKKNSDGMVPVIVQDYRTDQVLMLAYMDKEAYNKTLSTGKMTYFSRSRNELWIKGETSGHYQFVMSLTADCDLDTILAKVKQVGAACHTGNYSCFFNEIAKKDYSEKNPQKVLDSVFEVIKDRKANPREGSYTNYLFDKGLDKILKKVGEEATEMVIAAKNEGSNEIVYEMSDFLYHMMVLMAEKNVSWEDVTDELSKR
nr:bifunctional phosphoribosyl-AMP cyclohydrolase/phosphoribosyl-ATP diphosphatase HisIE [uncultured Butyrivibrio sp.]